MSVQEIESLAQNFCDTFNRMDTKAALDLLSDDRYLILFPIASTAKNNFPSYWTERSTALHR